MSSENEPVKCQEWLGDDSMTITSGTINMEVSPCLNGYLRIEGGALVCKVRDEMVTVDNLLLHIVELEKENKAWCERFPEYAYNSESGLICYKVSAWEEEN